MSLGPLVSIFLCSTWISLLPATSTVYVFFFIVNPLPLLLSSNPWSGIGIIVIGLGIGYMVLVAATWSVAVAGLRLVTHGKPVTESVFANYYSSPEWKAFSLRHVVKKFSMWFFQKNAPRWLYRKYVGSFIKMGKNVEIPEWTPMECAEIGDNTVFARQVILTSHLIDGEKITLKEVKVGKNCIIDSQDETTRTGISCGVVVEDNVIVKPGTFVPKDVVLKEGGIYQGDVVVERVGNVSDLTPRELNAYRKEVRAKRELKSRMLDEWGAFKARKPRILVASAKIAGFLVAAGMVILFLAYAMPALVAWLGVAGHVMNLLLLPFVTFIAIALFVFIPVVLIVLGARRYERGLPVLPDEDGATVEISDHDTIETWRACKWLKWQAVNRVNESLFLDTSMLVYQHIGKNNVAFKTVLYVSRTDTDYVTIGDNTVISFGAHIYAYTMRDGRLVLKRTAIGNNCVLASSIIGAGARIGDNVTLGCHTVVPEDTVLESGKVYAGNPAMEFEKFLEARRMLKKQKAIKKENDQEKND